MRPLAVYLLVAIVVLGLLSYLGMFSSSNRPKYSLVQSEGQRSGESEAAQEPEDCFDHQLEGPLVQDDRRLISYIRSNGIIESPSNEAYRLQQPKIDPSKGQSAVIKKIFKNKKNGFFIECGALDGETRSNTLSLEKDFGWEGILIEADPSNYKLVKTKNRKSWTIQACLAIHPYAHQVTFEQNFNIGKIVAKGKKSRRHVTVQCYPIYTILKALDRTTIDYFSLDVEGNELDVLKTIPFDKLNIKTLSVEFFHTPGGAQGIKEFMASKGYTAVTTVIDNVNNQANDFIFVKPGLALEEDVDVDFESG